MAKLYDELTNLYDQDLYNIDQDAPNMKVFNFLNRNKESINNIEKDYLECIENTKNSAKVKFTPNQVKVLENTFSWAINLLEEESKKHYTIFVDDNGKFKEFNFKAEKKKIIELFNFLKNNSEIIKE